MSYIITHSEIMLQVSDIPSTNTLLNIFLFVTVKKKEIPPLQKKCRKIKELNSQKDRGQTKCGRLGTENLI